MTLGTLKTWQGAGGEVRVHCFDSKADAGAFVAAEVTYALQAALTARGKAVWIGCGGTTPKPIYENLIQALLDWRHVTLTQVDERYVPTDSADSNTRMMREALAPVLAGHGQSGMDFISLIQDIDDQAACAQKAEAKLMALGEGGKPPIFDIALMGMGPDGHYASIFPHHAINATVYTTDALVLPVTASGSSVEPTLPRITLSVPALNNSRRILFFITGQIKLDVLEQMSASTDPMTSPIGAFLAQCPVPVDFAWAP